MREAERRKAHPDAACAAARHADKFTQSAQTKCGRARLSALHWWRSPSPPVRRRPASGRASRRGLGPRPSASSSQAGRSTHPGGAPTPPGTRVGLLSSIIIALYQYLIRDRKSDPDPRLHIGSTRLRSSAAPRYAALHVGDPHQLRSIIMLDHENANPTTPKHKPWNKGKLTGAKPPLRPKHVWSIEPSFRSRGEHATWRCSIWPSIANSAAAMSSLSRLKILPQTDTPLIGRRSVKGKQGGRFGSR